MIDRMQQTMALSCLTAVQQAYRDRDLDERRASKMQVKPLFLPTSSPSLVRCFIQMFNFVMPVMFFRFDDNHLGLKICIIVLNCSGHKARRR